MLLLKSARAFSGLRIVREAKILRARSRSRLQVESQWSICANRWSDHGSHTMPFPAVQASDDVLLS